MVIASIFSSSGRFRLGARLLIAAPLLFSPASLSEASASGASPERLIPAESSSRALPVAEKPLPPRALVLPFAAVGEAEPDWMSSGIAAFVAEAMASTGHRVVDPEERQDALEERGLAENHLTLAAGCTLARQLGALYLVTGTWEARGTRLVIVARTYDVERFRLVRESTSGGQAGTLGSILGSLVLDLAAKGGQTAEQRLALDQIAAASSTAIAAWMQATAEPDLAVQHLTAALEASPQFAPALLALADTQLDLGKPEAVAPLLAKLPGTASLQQVARGAALSGRAQLAMGNARGAFDLLTDAVSAWPEREPLLWLGEAALASGDRATAALSAQRLLALVPDDDQALDLQRRASNGPS